MVANPLVRRLPSLYRRFMRILILTSKDHPYANVLLGSLLRAGTFAGDELFIAEQDWVLPHRSALQGVRRYAQSAGWRYVIVQAVKQYLFRAVRLAAYASGRMASPFYPYTKLPHPHLHARVLQNLRSDATVAAFEEFAPDILLSLLSKEIIPERVLRIPVKGSFNLHPAPLPRYRGVSPTFWVLANGDTNAGCTLHRIDCGIDTGEILGQTDVSTEGVHTEHALYMRCMAAGALLLREAIATLRAGAPQQQILGKAVEPTYFSLPTKDAVKAFYARGYAFFRCSEFLHPPSGMPSI